MSPRPLTTYRVTIDITLDDSFAPPEAWDWVDMLDPEASPGLLIGPHAVTRIPLDADAAERIREYDRPLEVTP